MVAMLVRALGVAATLAVLGFGSVYALSEWKMRRTYHAPLEALRAAPTADAAPGKHMAMVVGCWAGCHGDEGEGGFEQLDGIHRNTAPTLSQVLPFYSDAELVRLIRYGVKRDGRSAVGMYPGTLWSLSDQDLANIIAHLRGQPARPPVERRHELTWRGRLALATGEWKVSAEQVDRSLPRWGELPRDTAFERGRYLASITCSECHGRDFHGDAFEGGPSLALIAIYQPDQFRQLLRNGKPIGGRDIPAMNWMPDVDFTDQEIDDLYEFLRGHHSRAGTPD